MTSIYDQHLDRNPANFVALSPVSFVERSAEVFGDLPAVVHGARRYTWAQCRERSAQLAAALRALGVDARHLEGGIAAWRDAARPVQPIRRA